MKAVRNSLALFAASVVIAGAAQVQDQSALFSQGMLTNFSARITLDMKTEPELGLGLNTQVTGVLVDCLSPQQTWNMLNPSVTERTQPKPIPPHLLPVKVPRPINDPTVHEPDFALLRLSFP